MFRLAGPYAVPYKGAAPAITDLISGQIQVMFTTVASAASLIEGGQLRALAVTSAERSPAFPDLPTVSEAGVPGYDAEAWYGLLAPAKTPPAVIAKLNQAVHAAMSDPVLKEKLAKVGAVPAAATPEEFRTFLGDELARWGKVIREKGIKED